MKSNWNNLAFIPFIFTVTACASLTGVDPSSLNKTAKSNHVEIEQSFSWKEHFNISNLTHHMTLKSGQYKAYFDDRKGTYYEGSGTCLEWTFVYDDVAVEPVVYNYKCGVYVPNDGNERINVYYYIDPEASKKVMDDIKLGALIKALDRAEWDNLKHLMYQPDEYRLRESVKVVD